MLDEPPELNRPRRQRRRNQNGFWQLLSDCLQCFTGPPEEADEEESKRPTSSSAFKEGGRLSEQSSANEPTF